jgi:hypothetical protein
VGAAYAKADIRAAVSYLLQETTDGIRGDIVQAIISIVRQVAAGLPPRAAKFFGRPFAWRIAGGLFDDLTDCAPTIASTGRIIFRNDTGQPALPFERLEPFRRDDPMNILPVDRALRIYGALADRAETRGARESLSRHLMKLYIDGEKDEHRLTVHGLTFLQNMDREIDSRN